MHTSDCLEHANQRGITPDNVCHSSIASSIISTLVGDCTHPIMGSTDIITAMIHCASVGLHPLHDTWPYSLNIAQRMTTKNITTSNITLPTDSTSDTHLQTTVARYICIKVTFVSTVDGNNIGISTHPLHHTQYKLLNLDGICYPCGMMYTVLDRRCSCISGINTVVLYNSQPNDSITPNMGSMYHCGNIDMTFVTDHTINVTYYTGHGAKYINHHCLNIVNYMSAISMITAISVNAMIGNNEDNINMHLSDGRLSSYTTGNRSTLHVKLDLNDINNAHTGTGFEQIAYTFTNDYGEINEYQAYTCEFYYNDRMGYRIIQSWMLHHVLVTTNDNSMCNLGVTNNYLFQTKGYYLYGIQLIREHVMNRGKRIVNLCLGIHMLIYWMTKANRRGVTCTEKYGFVWYLFVPLFVRKSSF